MAAEEGLTPEVRAKVLEHFIFSAPPAESGEVIAGACALDAADLLCVRAYSRHL